MGRNSRIVTARTLHVPIRSYRIEYVRSLIGRNGTGGGGTMRYYAIRIRAIDFDAQTVRDLGWIGPSGTRVETMAEAAKVREDRLDAVANDYRGRSPSSILMPEPAPPPAPAPPVEALRGELVRV